MTALRSARALGVVVLLVVAALVAPAQARPPRKAGIIYYLDEFGTLHRIRPDGTGDVELGLPGTVSGVSASPDGRWVAFVVEPPAVTDPHFSSVWVARRELTGARRVLDLPGVIQGEPTWSPDSARLALTQGYPAGLFGIGYQSHLWVVGRDGTGARPVVALPGSVGRARWAPRGDAVVFTVDSQESSAELALVHVDATPPLPHLVTQPPDVVGADKARWSPDATQLSYMDGSSTYVLRPDGSGRRRVGPGSSFPFDGGAAWSPDGGRLAVCASSSGYLLGGASGEGLRVLALSRPGAVRTLDASGPCFDPTWSPDGRWLAYPRAGATYASLVVLDAVTGRARDLAEHVSSAGVAWAR